MASHYRRANGTYCVRVSNGLYGGRQQLVSATFKPRHGVSRSVELRELAEFERKFERAVHDVDVFHFVGKGKDRAKDRCVTLNRRGSHWFARVVKILFAFRHDELDVVLYMTHTEFVQVHLAVDRNQMSIDDLTIECKCTRREIAFLDFEKFFAKIREECLPRRFWYNFSAARRRDFAAQ